MHPLLAYMFRTLGIASLILGVGGTMSGTSFIFSAVCIYLGLLILVCDPWVEPSLNNRPVGRSLISVTFLVVMLLFSFGVVFYPAPLDTLAMSYEGRYKPGEVVYGIKWDDDMSDLRVDLNNPTERDYDHLDLILRLLDGRQIRNYSVVRTFPHVDLSPTGKEMHVKRVNKDGKLVDEENVPATGWPELRLACDRLPKKTTIALIFAVAEFDPSAKKAMTSPDGPTATDGKMDYWVLNSDDPQHDKLWKRSRATALRVFGDYTVIGRPHHVDYTYAVKQE